MGGKLILWHVVSKGKMTGRQTDFTYSFCHWTFVDPEVIIVVIGVILVIRHNCNGDDVLMKGKVALSGHYQGATADLGLIKNQGRCDFREK